MRFATVLGTRPEIIKLSPILRSFASLESAESLLIHTNQHYDREMDAIFFEELSLSAPDYNLGVGSHAHGRQVGLMLASIEEILLDRKPDVMVVQGDTNSTFAGALAAAKLNIPVAHVEAGLRSFDMTMPEEVNRVMTDHISTFRFAPTKRAAGHLIDEGISKGVHVVGNTVVDALFQNIEMATASSKERPWGEGRQFILATLHRDSNTDSPTRLDELLTALATVHDLSGLDIVLPAHPRVIQRLDRFDLLKRASNLDGVHFVKPMGYLEFLVTLKHARIVLTDSGGVQEEACILGVPCVTVRTSTERQETLEVGSNVLAPTGADVVAAVEEALELRHLDWPNPFGEGDAGQRIVECLTASDIATLVDCPAAPDVG
jgi:UDP-N-acetylglucosamine 2-epimerase (non-hydrolysing)